MEFRAAFYFLFGVSNVGGWKRGLVARQGS